MNQRESWEKFESRQWENKREGGREGGGGKKKGGKRRKREGVELESGGRLLLWPDVNLSKQPRLRSQALPLDSDLPFAKTAVDIYWENVRKAQKEVQLLCQRGTVWRRGSHQGRQTLCTPQQTLVDC